jgi:hypothetical protein
MLELILTVVPTPVILTKAPPFDIFLDVIPLAPVQVKFLLVVIAKFEAVFAAPVKVSIVASTSSVTVCPAPITASSTDVGGTPPTHVALSDQFPVAALVIVAIRNLYN